MAKRIYGSLALQNQSQLQLLDALSSHSVNLQAPFSLDGDVTFSLPSSLGSNFQLMGTDGAGQLSFSFISNSNVAGNAAIAMSKLASVTAGKALVSDSSGVVSASSISGTELGRLSGVTGNVQSQLDTEVSARETAVSNEVSAREAAVSAEQSARVAADSAEQAARIAADASEAGARQAADTQEANARQAADAQEVSDRQAAVQAEQDARVAAMSQEVTARQSGDAAEQAAREAGDSALSSRLNVIEGSGEGSVQKAKADSIAYTDAQVASLVNSAPEILNTLKELADAIGDDANFATTISNQIGAEATARTTADATEQAARIAAVSAEATARANADSSEAAARLAADQAETSSRESADSALGSRIDSLNTSDVAEDAGYLYFTDGRAQVATIMDNTDSDGEETNKTYSARVLNQSFSDLSQSIDVLLQNADNSTQAAITSLQGDLSSAVASLQSDLATEQTARQTADTSEATARIAADAALSSSISQEVSDRQAAVSSEATARAQAVSTEAAARQAADASEATSRQAADEAEAGTRAAADTSLQNALSSETSAREAADTQEASARSAADAALQTSLNQEASARSSGDMALSGRLDVVEGTGEGSVKKALADSKTYTDNSVAALVASAPEVLNTLKELADAIGSDQNFATTIAGQIGSEASAREAADLAETSARETAISTEASARAAADTAEQTARENAISAEASARQAADADLASDLSDEVTARVAAVSSEASARATAVSSEASSRAAADATEQAAREAGDAAVQAYFDSFRHKTDWVTGDGVVKSISHSMGTTDIIVQVFDKEDGETIDVEVDRSSSSSLTLTASEAPGASGWRVLLLKV